MTDPREEAIADCKYSDSLGGSGLAMHITIWHADTNVSGDDIVYRNTIIEIKEKLRTDECLLM